MNYLVDNDYLFKLASYDLLSEMVQVTGGTSSSFYILPDAESYMNRCRDFRGRECDDMKSRASAFMKKCEVIINPSPCPDVRPLVNLNIAGLDPGELGLLSASYYCTTDYCILTGDKRFLRALAAEPLAADARDRVSGNITCLEQTLIQICEQVGYPAVKQKIDTSRNADDGIERAFCYDPFLVNSVRRAMKRIVAKLRAESGSLLISDPV